MRIVDAHGDDLAKIKIDVDGKSGACRPNVIAGGYEISGPDATVRITSESKSSELKVDIIMAGVLPLSIYVSKDDVKGLKGLMNKDALGFMIKAFM